MKHHTVILLGFASACLLLICGSLMIAAAMPQEDITLETERIPGANCQVWGDNDCHSLTISGGVHNSWLKIQRHNLKAFDAKGFDPCYTSIESDFKPIAKKLPNGKWEITFVSEGN